jgi:hypothetical protein
MGCFCRTKVIDDDWCGSTQSWLVAMAAMPPQSAPVVRAVHANQDTLDAPLWRVNHPQRC